MMKSSDLVPDSSIVKIPLYGFILTKRKIEGGHYTVFRYPIPLDWRNTPIVVPANAGYIAYGRQYMHKDEEPIGYMSAPPHSYFVFGKKEDSDKHSDVNTLIKLGYEFEGVDNPDWKEVLAGRRRDRKRKNPENTET